MIGPFWRTRRLWSCYGSRRDGESTDGEFSTAPDRSEGNKSPMAEFSPWEDTAFRLAPRTPGPGAAWSGGRL